MKRKVVLLYSNIDDPIHSTLEANIGDEFKDVSLDKIFIDELMPYLDLSAEWPEVAKSAFPKDLLARFENALILNRIFSISGNTRSALDAARCHELWIHVRLSELLKKGRRLVHDTGVRGASRCILPLNTQWFMINASDESIKTPNFVYGFAAEQPDVSGLEEPLQKSIWSVSDWRTEMHMPSHEASWHKFYVEKPIGTPVVCFYFGDDLVGSLFPRERVAFDDGVVRKLVDISRRIFKSDIGELLIYVEADGEVRFQAFSPHLYSAAEDPAFRTHVIDWISKAA